MRSSAQAGVPLAHTGSSRKTLVGRKEAFFFAHDVEPTLPQRVEEAESVLSVL